MLKNTPEHGIIYDRGYLLCFAENSADAPIHITGFSSIWSYVLIAKNLNFSFMERIGKMIVLVGVLVVVAGLIVWLLGDKLRFLGRLPGDISIERENYKIYFPITTMIFVSVLLTLIMWVIQRLGR
jgi:hypothetical protein